jgi:hypothetical protein
MSTQEKIEYNRLMQAYFSTGNVNFLKRALKLAMEEVKS